MGILVMSNIVHFYTVSFLTATTALKQLDKEFETVSESMGVPFYKTFFRVTAPVCLPAILEICLYYFVNSMATVSAVIFLYSADTKLASVAVANMDDAGDIAPACAHGHPYHPGQYPRTRRIQPGPPKDYARNPRPGLIVRDFKWECLRRPKNPFAQLGWIRLSKLGDSLRHSKKRFLGISQNF